MAVQCSTLDEVEQAEKSFVVVQDKDHVFQKALFYFSTGFAVWKKDALHFAAVKNAAKAADKTEEAVKLILSVRSIAGNDTSRCRL